MSTRMQQRRGSSSQWTTSNPVLAAGEIGFETNTGKFKMGDGGSTWSALSYFTDSTDFDTAAIQGQISTAVSNAVDALVSGAPAALDTLNEIAAAINDDATFYSAMTTQLNNKMNKTNPYIETNLNANTFKIVNLGSPSADNDAATKLFVENVLIDHATDTTNVHGIGDTANLATKDYADTSVSTHSSDTTNVHGIGNTADLATKDYADTAISTHSSDTTGIHGITDTQALATKTYADTAVSTHSSDTTNVHGITDTEDLATKTYATSAGTTAVSTHNSGTTNVHGISNTAVLATATTVATAKSEAITEAGTAADTKVSTAVAALTKSSVGLGNVNNTSDGSKPISTATQTALDLKAPKATPTFTGTLTAGNVVISGNLTVSGTTTTVATADLVLTDPMIYMGDGNTSNLADLGFVASFNDGTYQHAGLVRDASANTWKLFKGVTDEPTTTVNFTQGSLDSLSVGPLVATTVTPSSGIVFSDGTQTKAGVPSITSIPTALAAGAHSIGTGRADQFIPLVGAVVITLPATGYSTGQSIDFFQESGTGAYFASTNSVVGTPGLKFRTTYSVATAMKTSSGWLVFGDLSA